MNTKLILPAILFLAIIIPFAQATIKEEAIQWMKNATLILPIYPGNISADYIKANNLQVTNLSTINVNVTTINATGNITTPLWVYAGTGIITQNFTANGTVNLGLQNGAESYNVNIKNNLFVANNIVTSGSINTQDITCTGLLTTGNINTNVNGLQSVGSSVNHWGYGYFDNLFSLNINTSNTKSNTANFTAISTNSLNVSQNITGYMKYDTWNATNSSYDVVNATGWINPPTGINTSISQNQFSNTLYNISINRSTKSGGMIVNSDGKILFSTEAVKGGVDNLFLGGAYSPTLANTTFL